MNYLQGLQILRYNDFQLATSNLDPLEDMITMIKSLQSEGYVREILLKKHSFSNASEIKRTSKSISQHVNVSLKLFDQGMASHSEISFLPLYYSILNLSKVQILLNGSFNDLLNNKAHGASYEEKQMAKRNFLNEEISLKRKGSINLLYKNITGQNLPTSKVKIDDLYQNLHDTSSEYKTVTGKNISKQVCNFYFDHDDNGFFIRTSRFIKVDTKNDLDIRKMRPIKSPNIWVKQTTNNYNVGENDSYWFETKRIEGDFNQVQNSLLRYIDRSFLVTNFSRSGWGNNNYNSFIQIKESKRVILPEEVNILLAFFHLSNIVRYNPEHLNKLMNSKYSMLINVLQKHGFLRYLKLFWSNVVKANFELTGV